MDVLFGGPRRATIGPHHLLAARSTREPETGGASHAVTFLPNP